VRAELFGNSMVTFSTYPDGILNGKAKFLLYYIIPVGMAIYQPVRVMISFDLGSMLKVLAATFLLSALAVVTFYRGLKRYASSNLMEART